MRYEHFTTEERVALQAMTAMKLSKSYIAFIVGKDRSSVYRELGRNSCGSGYCGLEADSKARARREEGKPSPKTGNAALMNKVVGMFKSDCSPEQIAGRLKTENPDRPQERVSTETIYQYVYRKMAGGEGLSGHFRQGHKKRKRRTGRKDGRGQIRDRTTIAERPKEAELKVAPGHYEGDTVEGKGKTAYLATFVDKCNKMLFAKWMPNKAASTLNNAAGRIFKKLPHEMRATITTDNGKEFALHHELAEKTGCDIYFAHPYHSWERGLNEHTNGLLRQYFPKGMSFATITQSQLDKAVWKINNRPRKALGYRTPYEVFLDQKVALQT